MKFKKSDLEILDFYVLNSRYKFIEPTENRVDVDFRSIFDQYEIDIDFMPREFNNQYAVFVKISINEVKQPIVGYSMFYEAVGIFNISNKEQISQIQLSDYLWNSAVRMCISHLRAFVSNITSSFPMGKFVIPSLDLNAHVEEKKMQMIAEAKKSAKS